MKKILNKIHSDVRLSAIFYGVTSSLVATTLWNYSWLFLNFVGEYSFGFLQGFVDSRYAKAATLEITNYSFFMIAISFIVMAIGWFEISKKIKKDFNRKQEDCEDKDISKERSENIPHWVAQKVFLIMRIIISIFLLNGLLFITGEVIVLNAISDFKQHLRIVTPYLDDKEKDLIISDWSQMRNLDDYNEVYKVLLEVAKENKLKLYRNRTY